MQEQKALQESKHYESIKHEGLKELIVELYESALTCELAPDKDVYSVVEKADKELDVVMKMLEDSGQYKEGNPRTWVDVIVSAAFIYELFWNEEHPITSLYMPRELIMERMADSLSYCDCDYSILMALFETVECARGCRTKVQKCMPVPNSPQQVLGDAVWYTDNFNG